MFCSWNPIFVSAKLFVSFWIIENLLNSSFLSGVGQIKLVSVCHAYGTTLLSQVSKCGYELNGSDNHSGPHRHLLTTKPLVDVHLDHQDCLRKAYVSSLSYLQTLNFYHVFGNKCLPIWRGSWHIVELVQMWILSMAKFRIGIAIPIFLQKFRE